MTRILITLPPRNTTFSFIISTSDYSGELFKCQHGGAMGHVAGMLEWVTFKCRLFARTAPKCGIRSQPHFLKCRVSVTLLKQALGGARLHWGPESAVEMTFGGDPFSIGQFFTSQKVVRNNQPQRDDGASESGRFKLPMSCLLSAETTLLQ